VLTADIIALVTSFSGKVHQWVGEEKVKDIGSLWGGCGRYKSRLCLCSKKSPSSATTRKKVNVKFRKNIF
jgi:hypothetical protein